MAVSLDYLHAIPLKHDGDASLLGVSPDLTIYVEEAYTEHVWMAQHALSMDGIFIESQDEDFGGNHRVEPVTIPANAAHVQPGWHTQRLNFAGARHRGMRSTDRIDDVVRTLTIQEKMLISEKLGLQLPPPRLLGIAECRVVSEAILEYPDQFVVCKRLRLAYLLPAIAHDGQGNYDYDTHIVYLAHTVSREREYETSLAEALAGLPGVKLYRPSDCIAAFGHLFVADGGETGRISAVHIWRITHPE